MRRVKAQSGGQESNWFQCDSLPWQEACGHLATRNPSQCTGCESRGQRGPEMTTGVLYRNKGPSFHVSQASVNKFGKPKMFFRLAYEEVFLGTHFMGKISPQFKTQQLILKTIQYNHSTCNTTWWITRSFQATPAQWKDFFLTSLSLSRHNYTNLVSSINVLHEETWPSLNNLSTDWIWPDTTLQH